MNKTPHLPSGNPSPDDFVDAFFDWFNTTANTRYDEAVLQIEHALQTANLAVQEQAAPSLVAASLLHDVGHMIIDEHQGRENFLEHDAKHELAGCNWVFQYFGESVSEPIRLHVQAKRWLYTRDEGYREILSDASKRSLELQGGMMDTDMADAFEKEPFFEDAVKLRIWDDRAKVSNKTVPDLETYRDTLVQCLIEHRDL